MRAIDRLLASSLGAAPANGSGERRCCEWIGCDRDGVYRAPQSRRQLHRYWWFCLEHVREYNAAWNYYAGMSDSEVEADIRSDTVWQRPSWPLGAKLRVCGWQSARIRDPFGTFEQARPSPDRQPVTAEERALVVLELRPPITVAIVKTRYKELVKRHHPDANGGDKAAEERFKQISEAYRTVMNSLAS